MSYIYDFIVFPFSKIDLNPSCQSLIEEEKIRFEAFAENANNNEELELTKNSMFNK